ncbi:MAG: hypothetical protein RR311_01965 [Comamonas sp.]
MNNEMQLQLFPDVVDPSSVHVPAIFNVQVRGQDQVSDVINLGSAEVVQLSLYRQKKSQELSTPSSLDQKLLAQILSRSQYF